MIEPENQQVSIERQCELLGLSRSSYYYQGVEMNIENNETLMKEIITIHTLFPYMGSRRIREQLSKRNYKISRKKVTSLMALLKIRAIYGNNERDYNHSHIIPIYGEQKNQRTIIKA